MKAAVVLVTDALLVQVLRLPPDTRITAAGMDADRHVWLQVESETLPEAAPGSVPMMTARFKRTDTLINDSEFVSWEPWR